jgi:hypothetical protein
VKRKCRAGDAVLLRPTAHSLEADHALYVREIFIGSVIFRAMRVEGSLAF